MTKQLSVGLSIFGIILLYNSIGGAVMNIIVNTSTSITNLISLGFSNLGSIIVVGIAFMFLKDKFK